MDNEQIERYEQIPYEDLVQILIANKYSAGEEFAINRQRETKPEEFQIYFDYCEECKAKAREIKEMT